MKLTNDWNVEAHLYADMARMMVSTGIFHVTNNVYSPWSKREIWPNLKAANYL